MLSGGLSGYLILLRGSAGMESNPYEMAEKIPASIHRQRLMVQSSIRSTTAYTDTDYSV